MNNGNGMEAAGNIGIPADLILGAEDRMTPPAQAAGLIEALAQVHVEILPECGPHDVVRTAGGRAPCACPNTV